MSRLKLAVVSGFVTAFLLLIQVADAVDLSIASPLPTLRGSSWFGDSDYVCDDCNVLLISIDTLRKDHVGAYGYERETTPNVDLFAEQSIRFDDAISHAPSTLPSHASIFTSLIPEHHQAFKDLRQGLAPEATTMAEILYQDGFRTAAFTAGGQMQSKWGLDQGFDVYRYFTEPRTHMSRFSDIVDKADKWLDEFGDERFFLMLHTYEVHTPYTPPKRYLRMFDPDYDGPVSDEVSLEFLRDVFQNPVRKRLSEADRQHIIAAYDGEIRNMDDAFGDLLASLRVRGLYDNTLIIFTSDHGEEFGERGRVGWHSWTLYDELLRVPLVVKMPGSKFAGSVVAEVARGIDVLPTMLDVLGVETNTFMQGASLMDRLLNRRSDAVYAVSQRDIRRDPLPTAIRMQRWKLLDGALYDLAADPMERTDVSAQHPFIAEGLATQLALIRKHDSLPAELVELSEEDLLELKNLGYIQ